MSEINIKNNNIIYYFLITNINPKKKIFELINTNDKETYIEAQEILYIYINRKSFDIERTKIESRNNAFHIFISNNKLIFISYTNKKFFSTEQNFQLFDEINNYLVNNIQRRLFTQQSFLIEDEKEEIKDIINKYIEDIISINTIESFLGSVDTEKGNVIMKVDVNNKTIKEENEEKNEMEMNNNDNIIIKKILKNNSHSKLREVSDKILNENDKKNESSEDKIIKSKITNNPSIPYINSDKSNNILLKNESKNTNQNQKIKSLSKTVIGNHSNLKNKILDGKLNSFREKPNHIKFSHKKEKEKENNKNYSYNKLKYSNLNTKKYKPDSCSKAFIIGILISIVVIQIVVIPIIIYFDDFSI